MPVTGPSFLRIPPFPGHRAKSMAIPGSRSPQADLDAIMATLRTARVGGAFWCAPADGMGPFDVLIAGPRRRAQRLREAATTLAGPGSASILADHLDPWDACAKAAAVVADGDSEVALVAALLSRPLTIVGNGRYADAGSQDGLERVLRREIAAKSWRDPFTGEQTGPLEIIATLQRWRAACEANRSCRQIHGVAGWKRITADALLWDGTGRVRHARRFHADDPVPDGSIVLAWRSRSDAGALAALEGRGVHIGEIEDGMIRSAGLGANCVPPLSIVVDWKGVHFDPAQPSDLEFLLQNADVDEDLLARAVRLRSRLVRGGISKYGHDGRRYPSGAHGIAPASRARRVLVTAQVEDDRSVLTGGGGLTNLELLRRARALEPASHIIFKPHPDVEAGHRKGHVADVHVLELADEIDRSSTIAALLDSVDAVHVLTSLAGFEALLRGRQVITHGVPFYAGWGLTEDRGPIPARRTRQRTLDELVAITIVLYARYLDPVTRLPCEPEVLIDRIETGRARVGSMLIRLRQFQGWLNRMLLRKRG